MSPKSLMLSLVAVLMVGACTTVPGGRGGEGRFAACHGKVCQVAVSVVDCQVEVTPPTLEITGNDVEIHWDFDPASKGYTFDKSGIDVKGDRRGEFGNGHVAENGRKYILHDRNSFSETYKYDVNVLRGGVACPVADPWIYNN